ncbi:tetratricopeptide repeat protein [Crocinitomix catalasitica]|uniref:tetratricopeptide repeat protein n=1 Tax=Crocinitomix catalasitica TaxID=184607 RepID=UPI0004820B4B|nr:tetratricopeptide repeat protein [Crocinitomix catalasitica]
MAKDRKANTVEPIETLTSTENFIDKFKKPLIIAGVAIVVGVLGYVGYQKFVKAPKIVKAQNESWQSFYDFEKDSLSTAMLGTDDYLGMEDIASQYSGTPSADIANYAAGIAAMKNKDFETAISSFEKCDFEDIIVGSLSIGLIGDCYVELDQLDKAVNHFEKAANREENNYTTPLYLKKAGLVYEKLDQNDKAVKAYKKIKENWSESKEASDIDKYIARASNGNDI